MATVESQTVTLTINGREITVAKGRSLVEAASEAGIEIPVFCYEPRLGAGVGACRMCLCEIEGMPKLQTACTTPAGDGMVVNSHSGRAKEGQDAVLEFLLLNHPLDCPVCDKGGECPLQDLTFRYGPGVTRMTLPKRTHDKPVPVSPLIKLDRERCILCYRCTRFSESVSGDMQLVTENRGAHSMITTFEGRPYTNEFSGNVTELCPVGALTSSTYRFRARPWEIQNIPTICTGCAVGCNISASIREGHVVRMLSRNHPEVDEGWLCDRGRYALGHLRAPDRIDLGLDPRRPRPGGRARGRCARARLRAAAHHRRQVRRRARSRCWHRRPQTNEEAHLWARILAEGMAGGISVAGPDGHAGLDTLSPYLASIAELDTAKVIVVAGDTELSQRAPVIELRIRKAVTAGARVITVGVGGTRLETLRGAHHISTAAGTAHATVLVGDRSRQRARRAARRGRFDGGDLERPGQPGGRRRARPRRAYARRKGADHPGRQRAGRPRRRPGHPHARPRRWRQPSRARSRRSCCWAPTRWATGRTASAGAERWPGHSLSCKSPHSRTTPRAGRPPSCPPPRRSSRRAR